MGAFAQYITPEQAKGFHDELNSQNKLPLSYWQKRARSKARCCVCGAPVWRWA